MANEWGQYVDASQALCVEAARKMRELSDSGAGGAGLVLFLDRDLNLAIAGHGVTPEYAPTWLRSIADALERPRGPKDSDGPVRIEP